MVCCIFGAKPFTKWLIVNWTFSDNSWWYATRVTFAQGNPTANVFCKMSAISFRPQFGNITNVTLHWIRGVWPTIYSIYIIQTRINRKKRHKTDNQSNFIWVGPNNNLYVDLPILMALCKTVITLLLTHWSYHSITLSRWQNIRCDITL